jgi:hypothetical protein
MGRVSVPIMAGVGERGMGGSPLASCRAPLYGSRWTLMVARAESARRVARAPPNLSAPNHLPQGREAST